MMIKFFLVVFMASQALAASLPLLSRNKCQKFEVLVDCVEPCQPSCSWPDRPKCPALVCSKGCECQSGYLRATNGSGSICAPCGRKLSCGQNEELSSCADPCQPSCSWKDRPACLPLTCSSGCVCQKGFYRTSNETNSPCMEC